MRDWRLMISTHLAQTTGRGFAVHNHRSVLNSLSLSGLAATLVGNGIGRFAYIALMPVLIQQAWFNRTQAASLGAATLLGYLAGAPFTGRLTHWVPARILMRAAMLICSVSNLACAWHGAPFAWFVLWRTLAGVGGAVAMVLAPYLVLSRSPSSERGRMSGVVFSGVGLGVMASATVIPLFVGFGLAETWLLLGVACLLLTAVTWNQWSQQTPAPTPVGWHRSRTRPEPMPWGRLWPMTLLLIAYSLNAVGYLPHTLFWVDYIARELHRSVAEGAFFWAVFGTAAAVGPFLTGACADRFGFSTTLFVAFLIKAIGVALPVVDNSAASLFFSSAIVGMFTPGIATLVSSYAMTIVGVDHHKRAWGWMTFSFAAAQAVTGLVMVSFMTTRESYVTLFAISAWALVASGLCVIAMRLPRPIVVDIVGARSR
jgi:MFS family permease